MADIGFESKHFEDHVKDADNDSRGKEIDIGI
jgi:hypothetical protein